MDSSKQPVASSMEPDNIGAHNTDPHKNPPSSFELFHNKPEDRVDDGNDQLSVNTEPHQSHMKSFDYDNHNEREFDDEAVYSCVAVDRGQPADEYWKDNNIK